MKLDADGTVHFVQADREEMVRRVLDGSILPPEAEPFRELVQHTWGVFRKRSRIVALQLRLAGTVETDRGPMTFEPGDWLVTNHPEDDPGSDLWSVSAARMASTYERVHARTVPARRRAR